jgi:hypothetical protein
MTWTFWLLVILSMLFLGGLMGFLLGYPRKPLR